MRWITVILAVLLIIIQYPLWLGKGGWFRVRELQRQLDAAQVKNEELKLRNAKLSSEVESLTSGQSAIEDRARSELSMMKKDEIFVQLLDSNAEEKPAETKKPADKTPEKPAAPKKKGKKP